MDSMYMLGCGCIPTKLPCDLQMNMTRRKVLFPLGACDPGAASRYVPQITGEASHGERNRGQLLFRGKQSQEKEIKPCQSCLSCWI